VEDSSWTTKAKKANSAHWPFLEARPPSRSVDEFLPAFLGDNGQLTNGLRLDLPIEAANLLLRRAKGNVSTAADYMKNAGVVVLLILLSFTGVGEAASRVRLSRASTCCESGCAGCSSLSCCASGSSSLPTSCSRPTCQHEVFLVRIASNAPFSPLTTERPVFRAAPNHISFPVAAPLFVRLCSYLL